VVLTTATISIGFAVLGASEFTLVRHFGLVTAFVMVVCLLADLLLLPALLARDAAAAPGASRSGP
jgi:predicted RND superfamily exporter protein